MKWERELHTIIIRNQLKKCVRGCTLRKNLCVGNATQAIQKKEKKLWKYLHKNRRKQTQYLHKSLTLLCILHTTFISIRNSKIYSHFVFVQSVKEAAGRGRCEWTEERKHQQKTMFIQFCYISPSSHQMAKRKVHSLAYAIILRFSLANNQSANWRVTKLTLHTWSHHAKLPFGYDNLWVESNSRECV